MHILHTNDMATPSITPRPLYERRREFLRLSTGIALAGMLPAAQAKLGPGKTSAFSTTESPTPLKDVTSYNNFYEFGTGKEDPAQNAHALRVRPWTVSIEGLVKQVEPLGSAKYVEFITAVQPDTMPSVSRGVLDWPYTEGLRLDEAMHPLSIIAVGLYGNVLPNQNGAPLRLVVPWKYGFKSGKSIVKIRFTDSQPNTSWMKAAPQEYGFYSNVNPEVDHPRWSQATERRIGEFRKRKTLPFNGYATQVGQLYSGMDLRKYF